MTPDERAIIVEALEMWIGNEHDDIHEMAEDDDGKSERQRRVQVAEALFNTLAAEGGYR